MKLNPKYLLLAPVLAMAAGCGQQSGTAGASGAQGAPIAAGAQAPGSAPKGSTAREASDKQGEPESAAQAMQAGAHTTRLAFSSAPSAIPVGKPATWTLKITAATPGAPISGFETEMTKKMHLIVVRSDLSWFNHIHPTYKGQGIFTVRATLPQAGRYKLYADYTPTGGKQEVPQHEIITTTAGESLSSGQASLVADKPRGPWIVKAFASHPEGEPDKAGGARYQVALMPMPMPLKAGQNSMLHFQIRDAAGRPLSDLQPYLGAMGHCVILSADTSKYLHSHPMSEGMEGMDHSKEGGAGGMEGMDMSHEEAPRSGGPDVMFHTNFPAAGLYKAWGQFKHRGQIISASFVVNVEPGAPASTSDAPQGDEPKPHTH